METGKQAAIVPKERVVGYITNTLTTVRSRCYRARMFQSTVQESMHSRLWHEEERLREIDSKMRELKKHYNEYLDLQREALDRRKRMEVLLSIVGEIDYEGAALGSRTRHETAMVLSGKQVEELRSALPLWKAMEEYLQHVPETRIGEMEEFFQGVGLIEGNRQAIESALRRHGKRFRTRKQKREKYISLK